MKYSPVENPSKLCNINQLSGGQITLVNIIWMVCLSIYKPSPIYLLDEIDEALDEKNQVILGELIKKYLCKNCENQVIYISHHKSFISQANQLLKLKKIKDTTYYIN